MPKLIDHDVRRAELASAVWTVVTERGPEGATVREIARASGWSTGVISHYFRDKNDLIRFAFNLSIERSVERILAHATNQAPLEAIRIILQESLPSSEEQRVENRVWGVVLGQAFTDPDLALEFRSLYRQWKDRLVRLVVQGQADGSIRQDVDAEQWARLVMAIVDGYTIQSFYLSSSREDQREQVATLDRYVEDIASTRRETVEGVPAAPRRRFAEVEPVVKPRRGSRRTPSR